MDPLINAMVQTLTQSLFTALMNEAQIALDFRGQFEQMKTRLDLMNAFVTNSENVKSKNDFVKKALTKLSEVILEADNVLTDCLVRAEYRVEEYRCFDYSLQDPFFFYHNGKKLKYINSKMEQIEKSLSTYLRAQDTSYSSSGSHQVSRLLVSQDFNPSETIGLDDDVMKIKGWIFNANEVVEHIAIVGMGGLGKTTIAQKIFHDNEVLDRFDKMIWVCVSRAFSEEQVLRCMLQRLGKDVKGFDGSQLLGEIQQVLADKTCLIVMDDVWKINVEWWTNLCSVLPNRDGKKSCIIITTRNEGVASDMGVEGSRTHKPNTLNDHDSWYLFSKFAFSSSKGVCLDNEVEKLSKEIAKKCGGLPLAIKTIGALLAPRIGFPSECRQILETFHELTTEGRNSSVMASLQLSYDELPPHLKQCLICFCIYPEDFQIRAEQLIHWWMGEGLVQGKGAKSAAEIGYEYLSELIKRCLIEVVHQRGFDGRVYECKMHDMVRELIIKNSEEEDFCCFDVQGRQRATPDSRWIGYIDRMNKESLKNTSKLRAMLFMSRSETEFKNFGLLRSLRVLDFSNSQLKEINIDDLFHWISSLKRLACLNLSGIQGLEMVPPSIRNLRNLQLFVLTNSNSLKYLNPYITTLKRLIVLDVGFCPNLEYLPCGLGKLSHLQELSGFKVSSQSRKQCAQLLELKEMIQLRVLRISISDETEISENEMDSLSQMSNLKVLSIDADNCKNKSKQVLEMVDKLTPPSRLQELYLRNFHRETLPNWVNPKMLSRLEYLCVENGDLQHLNIKNFDKEIEDSIWNIEGLCLKFLMRLDVDWKDLQKDMPQLCYLEVSHCYKLKDFPCSVKTPGVWRKVRD
ncbi:hypothetical protein UlMin_037805 [Ulmus minor]